MTTLFSNHFFPKDESFGFEALRTAGYANFGCADVGEVIYICSRIKAGDEDGWMREWKSAADRAATNAKVSLGKGNRPAARDSYLRASNYYRTAEFYRRINPDQDEIGKGLSKLSSKMFYTAAELMPYVVEQVRIPYEDTTLPATWIRPDANNTPRPTIIVNGGYDSTREETGWQVAFAGMDLGFNVISFDGPGQGEVIREQKLVFRPDWENVLTPVVDYVLSQPYVDKDKLAILGISMGGYLVSRAVAFEHRAAAIILNDGVYDFGQVFRNNIPTVGKLLVKYGWDKTFNYLTWMFISSDTGKKWGMRNGMWVFGVTSEADVGRVGQKYTLEGVVDQIKTPTLVLDAPDDHFLAGQPKELFDRLKCDKTFVAIEREDGGSAHCAMGAIGRLNQVMFDYLTERFNK